MNGHGDSEEELKWIEAWCSGRIDEKTFFKMQKTLFENSNFRKDFVNLVVVDDLLRDIAGTQETKVLDKRVEKKDVWGYLIRAVAFILIGLFMGSGSVVTVWALNPDLVGLERENRRSLIFSKKWSFEDESQLLLNSYPNETDLWAGDFGEVVKKENQGVYAFEGSGMYRLKNTWFKKPRNSRRSNKWLIMNVEALNTGGKQLFGTFKMRCNRVDAGPLTDTLFCIEAYSFDSLNSLKMYRTNRSEDDVKRVFLTGGREMLESDSDIATWETIETKFYLPKNARYILLSVYAEENVENNLAEEDELAGHFIDGLEFNLSDIPELDF